MAKALRYMGEFLSRAGVVWRVEILQENYDDEVGVLDFEAEEALVIDWKHTDKEEVICGSEATIKIESPGDRTYEDLYTIEVGYIRMDVYRNNLLYWSGELDPEFYEEPYEAYNHYVVTLTFSDFGILDRLKYNLAGMRTLREIIAGSIQRAGIYTTIDESLISTCISGNTPMSLSDLKVRSDNFYDEDGEASTLKETIEGILQPLALKMIQRNGKVYVFDLNGLRTLAARRAIEWDGDSQTMGTDKVYNDVKITWSTYAQSGNLAPTECWTAETDPNVSNLNNLSPANYMGSDYFTYFYQNDLEGWADATDKGFTLFLNTRGKNATLSDYFTSARFFKIVPQYDGQECEGIAIMYPAVRGFKISSGSSWQAQIQSTKIGVNPAYIQGTLNDIDKYIFKSASVWIPPVDNPGKLLLRIKLEMMVDPRFNPFEQAENFMKWVEQKDWQDQWNARGNYLYIPVTIKFRPSGSNTVYCWDNRAIVSQDVNNGIYAMNQALGGWNTFGSNDDIPNVWGYLCYYDPSDREEKSGVAKGWASNRQAINPHKKKIASVLKNCEDGQYIPYPNFGGAGGDLWLEVRGDGWQISDGGVNLSTTEIIDSYGLFYGDEMRSPKCNWILAKLPEIEIMNNVQFDAPINTDDVEYKATINENAKESLEIDTICGSSANGVPTARGAYFNASSGAQIIQLTRAGRTTQAEELLIGTLYSQYATRHTTLQGEAVLDPGTLAIYTEQNQYGKVFMISGETQDVIADITDGDYTELTADEYKKEGEQ